MTEEKKEYDWQAITRPLNLSGKPSFPPEVLEQHDYGADDDGTPIAPEFHDRFIWSFDKTLAAFIDTGLTAVMGHAYTVPEDGIERARDIFRAYATKDDAPSDKENAFPFETIGSPEHNDLMWALDWLKEHFTALWT
jgi:hypothetical protein